MTEEEKLARAPGCGTFIMAGLIGIVLLSLAGILFPIDLLPYPTEILIVILIVSVVALIVAFFMWRGKKRDQQQAEDDKADQLLRQGFETLGDKDDEAARLAKLYDKESE